MKHIWMILVAGAALASCSQTDIMDNPNDIQNNKELVMTSFKAYAPVINTDSRTSLETGNLVYWNDGDAIAVSSRYGNPDYGIYKCTTTIEEGKAAYADFTGEVSGNEDFYVAFYPYDLFKYQQEYNSYFTIPTVQQAVAGTFATNTNPSWAFTDKLGGSLQFQNLGALVKFTLTGEDAKDLKSISLTSDQDQATLSGDFMYQYNVENPDKSILSGSDDWPTTKSGTVTLEGSFEPGNSYYFVIAPMEGVLSDGFTLTLEKTDGTRCTLKGQAGMIESIRSSEILNIGEVSLEGANFNTNISDFNFIAAVDDAFGGNAGWTKEEDGTVPLTEENLTWMASVTTLYINNYNLASLDYISYFTGLEELYCSDNNLKQVNLNSLKKLRTINIQNSGVTELYIDQLTELIEIHCSNNKLEALNLSDQNTNLRILNCYDNELSALDVTHLTNLESLYCRENKLTTLDLDDQNTNLRYLECSNNELSALQITHLTNLESLYCGSNHFTTLDLSGQNTNLRYLECSDNELSALDVTHLTNLESLNCRNNPLTTLDVTNLHSLRFLDFGNTSITDIDLSGLSNLEELNCIYTGLKELSLSSWPELRALYCWGMENLPAELDFSANPKLESLDCESTGITSLNVSQCPNLGYLYCCNNRISTLDLSNNMNLHSLYCYNQQLGSGMKLALYLPEVLQDLWNRISADHSSTVEVHFVEN